MAVSTLSVAVASISLAFGGAAYWDVVGSYKYPAKEGVIFLRTHDYKVLGGGDRDYGAKECGHAVVRRYDVEKDGKVMKDFAVCFSDLFWAHLPKGHS